MPEGGQLREAGRMGPFTRYPGHSVAWGGDSQDKGEHHTLSLASWHQDDDSGFQVLSSWAERSGVQGE